jgi:flotillin
MLEPMFGFLFGLGFVASMVAIVGIVLVGFIGFLTLFTIRKIPPGKAGVRVGFRGYVISDTWIFRIPLVTRFDLMDISVQKLEIERKGQDGLICMDNIRADIVVAFYIKVNYPKVNYPEGVAHDSKEGQQLFEETLASKRQAKFSDIQKVAQIVGCERATDIDKLRELFEAKFSEALKTAGKEMEFTKLYTDRLEFRDKIIAVIGKDLNGYTLEDCAIDYLEMTPLKSLDENNVLDAEGIKKITDVTSGQQEITNERLREKDQLLNDQNKKAELVIKDQNTRNEMDKRDLDRQNEEDLARRTREVDEAKAKEGAAAIVVVEQNRQLSEQAAIEANQNIQEREVERDRVVMSATYGKDQDLLRLEQEKIESGEQAEVDRTRRIGLAQQEKEAVIIEKTFAVAESRAGLESKEKEVTTQHQQRLDIEADMSADRAKRVLNIEAEARAQADQKKEIIAAEAEKTVRQERAEAGQIEVRVAALAAKEAAEHAAEKIQITADAEAKASEKRNHAMQQEAEGTAAMEAAPGVAEANVVIAMAEAKKADAEAEQALGLAEATVTAKQGEATGIAKAAEGKGEGEAISAKGTAEGAAIEAVKLAEALGKTEMAKAIELFNKASQDHEEFRLQLAKDRDVDLAEIQITKDVAEAQARVVGEALKSANIDIVGGENDFFEKVVKSVIQGRSVDRLMNNSQTLTDVKNTFFNGDPAHFKGQLRTWIQDLGVSSEDVKNLTVATLLTKLMSKADDGGTRSLIRQAQKAAKDTGITDIVVSALLGDTAAK